MEQEQKLKRREVTIEGAQTLIARLELLCSDLEDDQVDLEFSLGPWRPSRIPVEILCHIFSYASEGNLVWFRWNLMAVCRAWRRAAIVYSALWSTLRIRGHPKSLEQITGNRCGRFVYKATLTTPVFVRKAIRRSGGGPLNVDLWAHEYSKRCQDCFARCLVLVGEQLERWRSLRFNIKESAGIGLGPLFAGSFRSVSISSYSSDLVVALASRAPLLHTIEFAEWVPHDFAFYIGREFWPRIRKLNLGDTWCRAHQLQNLGQLLAACTALHFLELSDTYKAGPRPVAIPNIWPPNMPTLPRMRCALRLSAWHLLSGMIITTLYIGVMIPDNWVPENWSSDDWSTSGMNKIHLPKLKQLTCEGPPTALWAAELFDAPSIVDLVMVGLFTIDPEYMDDRDLGDLWSNMSLRPRNVILHWRPSPACYDLECFLPLLRCFYDIQCLTLRGILPTDADIFTQPQAQNFCPNLDHITWWLITNAPDIGELEEGFCNAARNCFGGPETHWTVERISRAEDDRTFFYVRTFLAWRVIFELKIKHSQFPAEN
jgi:F-box-like